jgi:membrane-bound lytic murein transglycosylase D
MLVRAGSTLLVPRSSQRSADVSGQVADNAMMLLAPDRPPGKRVTFKAGKSGDSVAAVAKRYRVGVEQVAQWNDVGTSAQFKPGQPIVIIKPVTAKAGKRTATVTAQRPGAAQAPAKRTAAAAKPAAKPTAKVAASRGNSKL